jgi:hypothetical protein
MWSVCAAQRCNLPVSFGALEPKVADQLQLMCGLFQVHDKLNVADLRFNRSSSSYNSVSGGDTAECTKTASGSARQAAFEAQSSCSCWLDPWESAMVMGKYQHVCLLAQAGLDPWACPTIGLSPSVAHGCQPLRQHVGNVMALEAVRARQEYLNGQFRHKDSSCSTWRPFVCCERQNSITDLKLPGRVSCVLPIRRAFHVYVR